MSRDGEDSAPPLGADDDSDARAAPAAAESASAPPTARATPAAAATEAAGEAAASSEQAQGTRTPKVPRAGDPKMHSAPNKPSSSSSSSGSSSSRTPGRLHNPFRSLKRKLTRTSLPGMASGSAAADEPFFVPPERPNYNSCMEDLLWFKYTAVSKDSPPATPKQAALAAPDGSGASSAGNSSSGSGSSSSGGANGAGSSALAERRPPTRGIAYEYVPAVYLRFSDREQPSRRAWFTVLYCLDNGEDIGTAKRGWLSTLRAALEVDVFAVDYAGYGMHRGTPCEATMNRDVCAAYRYLTEIAGVPPMRIIICGKGLGSAPACYLAQRLSRPGHAMPVTSVVPSNASEAASSPAMLLPKPCDIKRAEAAAAAAAAAAGSSAGPGGSCAQADGSAGDAEEGTGEKKRSASDADRLQMVADGCAGLVLICPRVRGTGDAKTSRFGDSLCDNQKRAPKIAYPVLVVHPTDHLLVPVGAAKRFSAQFRRLHKFVTVPGADLDSVLDVCDEYLDEVAAFLQSVSNNEYVIKTLRKVPAHIAESPAVAVTAWFAARGLKEYAEQVLAFGFYDLAALKTATQQDFEAIGIADPTTRALLIAAFAQTESLFEEHPNRFVCLDRALEGGMAVWRVASFDDPRSQPDVVSMVSLAFSVETTRTKNIIRAIGTFEAAERRKAEASGYKPPQDADHEPSPPSSSSSSSSSLPPAAPGNGANSSNGKPLLVVRVKQHERDNSPVPPLPRPAAGGEGEATPRRTAHKFQPNKLVRTTTEADISLDGVHDRAGSSDSAGGAGAGDKDKDKGAHSKKHKHRRHEEQRASVKLAPLNISAPPPSPPVPRNAASADGDPSATQSAITPSTSSDAAGAGKDAAAAAEPRSNEAGSLEAFLATVLKKSSAQSSTVRGQAKLLFAEGVFTVDDLDALLRDPASERWQKLSAALDKRVALACATRAKLHSPKPRMTPTPSAPAPAPTTTTTTTPAADAKETV